MKMERENELKVSVIGLLSNLGIAVLKLLAGFVANSTALIADGINSLSDMFSALVAVFSFIYSSRPADEKHPYGHERMEFVASFVVTIIMAYLGIDLVRQSITSIISVPVLQITLWSFAIIILSLIVKAALSVYYTYEARKTDSMILGLQAKDARNDMFISLGVLISMLVQYFYDIQIDGYVSLLIALFILYSSALMVKKVSDELIGKRPSLELLEAIEAILNEEPRILGYHDLWVHNYGRQHIFGSVDVELDARLSLMEAHDLIDGIEETLLKEHKLQFSIHLDPINLDDTEAYKVEDTIKSYLEKFVPEAGYHDVYRTKENTYRFDLVYQGATQEMIDRIESELNVILGDKVVEIIHDDHQII